MCLKQKKNDEKHPDYHPFYNLSRLGVLVFLGKEDVAVCNKKAKEVHGLIPGDEKKIVVVDGLGHGSFSDGLIAPFTFETVHNHMEKYKIAFKYEEQKEVAAAEQNQARTQDDKPIALTEPEFSFGALSAFDTVSVGENILGPQ